MFATILLCMAMDAVAIDNTEYSALFERAQATNGTAAFVVSVGTEWCPGCRVHKERLLNRLARRKVSHAYVDADTSAKTATALLDGDNTIPQVIAFRRVDGVWYRRKLVGSQVTDNNVTELFDWVEFSPK